MVQPERAAEQGVVKAEMRAFGGLPGVWRGVFHPSCVQSPRGTVPAIGRRGSGYPIRSIYVDNPNKVRGV
jgi:hypothetical protein